MINYITGLKAEEKVYIMHMVKGSFLRVFVRLSTHRLAGAAGRCHRQGETSKTSQGAPCPLKSIAVRLELVKAATSATHRTFVYRLIGDVIVLDNVPGAVVVPNKVLPCAVGVSAY